MLAPQPSSQRKQLMKRDEVKPQVPRNLGKKVDEGSLGLRAPPQGCTFGYCCLKGKVLGPANWVHEMSTRPRYYRPCR